MSIRPITSSAWVGIGQPDEVRTLATLLKSEIHSLQIKQVAGSSVQAFRTTPFCFPILSLP